MRHSLYGSARLGDWYTISRAIRTLVNSRPSCIIKSNIAGIRHGAMPEAHEFDRHADLQDPNLENFWALCPCGTINRAWEAKPWGGKIATLLDSRARKLVD